MIWLNADPHVYYLHRLMVCLPSLPHVRAYSECFTDMMSVFWLYEIIMFFL